MRIRMALRQNDLVISAFFLLVLLLFDTASVAAQLENASNSNLSQRTVGANLNKSSSSEPAEIEMDKFTLTRATLNVSSELNISEFSVPKNQNILMNKEVPEEIDSYTPTPESNASIPGPAPGSEAKFTNQGDLKGSGFQLNSDIFHDVSYIPIGMPGSIDRFLRTDLTNAIGFRPTNYLHEPAVANLGHLIFYTGNTFAARSEDSGQSWHLLPDWNIGMRTNYWAGGVFHNTPDPVCCDQDVITFANNFLWVRQGSASGDLSLGVSQDGALWRFINFNPMDFPAVPRQPDPQDVAWFDYPHLATTNGHLYIVTGIQMGHGRPGQPGDNENWGTLIIRIDRDAISQIAAGNPGNVTPEAIYSRGMRTCFVFCGPWSNVILAPVQGASNKMFFAAHFSNSQLNILSWDDSSPSFESVMKTTDGYAGTGRESMHCASPGTATNWCNRGDDRVLTGFVWNDLVGFFWNVKEGSGYPNPHIVAAVFRLDDLTYLQRESQALSLWNPNFAIVYPYVAPALPSTPSNGLAIVAYKGSSTLNPTVFAGIHDSRSSRGWDLTDIVTGNSGPISPRPSDDGWGDYIRVRPFVGLSSSARPVQAVWIGSAFTADGTIIHPHYFVFGRASNNPGPLTAPVPQGPPRTEFINIMDGNVNALQEYRRQFFYSTISPSLTFNYRGYDPGGQLGIIRFHCILDGVDTACPGGGGSPMTSASISIPVPPASLSIGNHQFSVSAINSRNTEGSPASFRWWHGPTEPILYPEASSLLICADINDCPILVRSLEGLIGPDEKPMTKLLLKSFTNMTADKGMVLINLSDSTLDKASEIAIENGTVVKASLSKSDLIGNVTNVILRNSTGQEISLKPLSDGKWILDSPEGNYELILTVTFGKEHLNSADFIGKVRVLS